MTGGSQHGSQSQCGASQHGSQGSPYSSPETNSNPHTDTSGSIHDNSNLNVNGKADKWEGVGVKKTKKPRKEAQDVAQ